MWVEPSATERSLPAASVTVGATLATLTLCVSVLPADPSESVACAETLEAAGPSGKLQSKLPALFVCVSLLLLPLAPQQVSVIPPQGPIVTQTGS